MIDTSLEYVAERPMGYFGVELDRGAIFRMKGGRNDEKLVAYRYATPFPKNAQKLECNRCGLPFRDHAELDNHGRKRHPDRPMTPQQEDAAAEREDSFLQQVAPLAINEPISIQGPASKPTARKREVKPRSAKKRGRRAA